MSHLEDRSTVVAALFGYLDEVGVDYCALGNVRAHLFSENSGRTPPAIRIVVLPSMLDKLPQVLHRFCMQRKAKLVEYREQEPQRWHCLLSWLDADDRPAFVALDIHGDYIRSGVTIFTAAELLNGRIPVGIGPGHRIAAFCVSPAKNFVCSLLECLDRDELSEDAAAHLSVQWHRDPPGAESCVQKWWNHAREGGVIIRCAQSGNWEPVRRAMVELRTALPRSTSSSLRSWWRGARRALARWRNPGGLLVACLGPDGSGKASVMDALSGDPLAPFAEVDTMHLRPGLLRRSGLRLKPRNVVEKPRGLAATFVKLAMFAVDYWLGYWMCVRPKLVRATLLISHRYFDDVLVDPMRYRMAGPRRLARVLLPLIPRPELWLVFDLPGETLQARKHDVSEEEAERQRQAYRRALRRHESFVMLDARQPLPKVLAEAERAIVAQLAQRTAERLGLPTIPVSNRSSTNLLLFFCRHDVPVLSKLVRIVFNSDISCLVPTDIHLPHPYGLVIHSQAVIGRRVTILQQVTIGGKDRTESIAPVIGNDVYIGAGARILGDVRIGDGAVIGANAVVTRDIPPGVTVVGTNRILGQARIPGRPVTERPTVAELPRRKEADGG